MSYHKDPKVNAAALGLLEELCTWERETGRGSTFILIPHNVEEQIVAAVDGKPVPLEHGITLKQLLTLAAHRRYEETVEKTCSTCGHRRLLSSNPACKSCTSAKSYPNWKPKLDSTIL